MAYLPLSTANLPDPAIDPAQGSSPEDYFNTVLYPGNGTTNAITGVGFQPDFVWTKLRSQAGSHSLADVIRGGTAVIRSDLTNAETTRANHIQSFDADGFTLAGDGTSNLNGTTNVAWNWKANGSGVSNNVGSIPSTVSANTTSGFSICTFSGASSGTVGHGLGVAPKVIIMKTRTSTLGWYVYTETIGSSGWLQLDTTAAAVTGNTAAFGGTDPTSTVFTYGSGLAGTGNYVAYCFADVEGFSKFGSFIGDGSTSASGPFVYLGFRPAFVILKPAEESRDWRMYDSKRNSYNRAEDPLQANAPVIESNESGTGGVDFLSNGFKVRTSNPVIYNSSTKKIIYMAFAENPFKYSNAR